jgi:charged multivesicular body protein 4
MCVKRNHLRERSIEQLANQRLALDQQIQALENTTINMEVLKAMRSATESMRQSFAAAKVETVDEVVDELNEQLQLTNELSNALAQPLDSGAFDEDELLAELDALEQCTIDEQYGVVNSRQPSAPVAARREEDIVAELERTMPAVPSAALLPRATRPQQQKAVVASGGGDDDDAADIARLKASMKI